MTKTVTQLIFSVTQPRTCMPQPYYIILVQYHFQGWQWWLISHQVAYFENFWRVKKAAYKPPKCGLFSTLQVAYFEPWISHQIAANCGLNVAYFLQFKAI